MKRWDVAIAVPTRDRPELIQGCVDALAYSIRGSAAAVTDLVVVDNGPHEGDVHALALPAVTGVAGRVLREPRPGASRARNLALAELRTEIVVFIDDDVLVAPGWVDALVEPFADPEVVAVVGPIRLDYEVSRPRWLTRSVEQWLSAVDLGSESRRLTADEYGWTANLAVRRTFAVDIGGFEVRLGPGSRVGFAEDTEFLDRVRVSGGVVAYSALAGVRHRLDVDRLRVRTIVRRGFGCGRSAAEQGRIELRGGVGRRPIRALGALAGVVLRGFPLLVRGIRDPSRRRGVVVEQLAARAMHLGTAVGFLGRGTQVDDPWAFRRENVAAQPRMGPSPESRACSANRGSAAATSSNDPVERSSPSWR